MTDPQFEPTPPASPPAEGAPADLANRFFARLIDSLLLGLVYSVILVPVFVASWATGSIGWWGSFSGPGFVAALLLTAAGIGYFTFMESSRGQTVGKMILGLKTVGPDGGNPTTEQAFKRNCWYALSLVPVIGNLAQLAVAIYIAVTINNTGIGWHDTFAGGTRVVKVR